MATRFASAGNIDRETIDRRRPALPCIAGNCRTGIISRRSTSLGPAKLPAALLRTKLVRNDKLQLHGAGCRRAHYRGRGRAASNPAAKPDIGARINMQSITFFCIKAQKPPPL